MTAGEDAIYISTPVKLNAVLGVKVSLLLKTEISCYLVFSGSIDLKFFAILLDTHNFQKTKDRHGVTAGGGCN